MKIDFNKAKRPEILSDFVNNTVDLGKKAAAGAKEGMISIVEKSKNDLYLRRLRKYNPLFPAQYVHPSFNLPNMIAIADDAVRRGIDVCEGAIGWLSRENGIEILHLYDEAVDFSGLTFVPSADCDAIYYVDSFDHRRYIRIDCIFDKAHEERMAELKHIAHFLGAKRCSIEISESSMDCQNHSRMASVKESYNAVRASESMQQQASSSHRIQRSGRIEAEFEGSNRPKRPHLKWFLHDDSINRLIEMRCGGSNGVKSETLELSGSSSSTMSQKTAYAIDGAIGKMGAKASASMNEQATRECHSKLLFSLEF